MTLVCDLACGGSFGGSLLVSWLMMILSWLEQAAKDGTFFMAHTVPSVVASHYNGIDLQAVSEGFADGRSDGGLDSLEWAAAPVANVLARLVSPEAVL
jgi:hypothetical protein